MQDIVPSTLPWIASFVRGNLWGLCLSAIYSTHPSSLPGRGKQGVEDRQPGGMGLWTKDQHPLPNDAEPGKGDDHGPEDLAPVMSLTPVRLYIPRLQGMISYFSHKYRSETFERGKQHSVAQHTAAGPSYRTVQKVHPSVCTTELCKPTPPYLPCPVPPAFCREHPLPCPVQPSPSTYLSRLRDGSCKTGR